MLSRYRITIIEGEMHIPTTLLAVSMSVILPQHASHGDTVMARIGRLAEKDSITVLVTDSGLGGLSVAADLERRVRLNGAYKKARIVFANALPEANQGYNRMKTTAEKVDVFDAALAGMARWYSPDAILVACNTLSVLIPQTRFARESSIPVLGIVETGVEMLYDRLSDNPRAKAVIFGTETTIGMGKHRQLLVERGIDTSRLVNQACPNLAGMIEEDARGERVQTAIEGFVSTALGQFDTTPDTVIVALCCTHYGYSAGFFEGAFKELGTACPVLVDPNGRMGDVLFPPGLGRRTDSPEISVEVVSRAVISFEEIASIGGLLEPVSPATANALRSYTLKKDLFPYLPR